MGDLEEAKQLLGEAHSILDQRNIRHANLSIVQGNIEKVQMLLTNMKEGEAAPHTRMVAKLNWDELERESTDDEPVCTCGHPISAHVMEPIDDLSICQLCPHGDCKDFSIHTNGKPPEEIELCPTCNGSGFIPETGAGCPSCGDRGIELPAKAGGPTDTQIDEVFEMFKEKDPAEGPGKGGE